MGAPPLGSRGGPLAAPGPSVGSGRSGRPMGCLGARLGPRVASRCRSRAGLVAVAASMFTAGVGVPGRAVLAVGVGRLPGLVGGWP